MVRVASGLRTLYSDNPLDCGCGSEVRSQPGMKAVYLDLCLIFRLLRFSLHE